MSVIIMSSENEQPSGQMQGPDQAEQQPQGQPLAWNEGEGKLKKTRKKTRKKPKIYDILTDRYSEEDMEEATPFGRAIMEQVNDRKMSKVSLAISIGVSRQTFDNFLTKPLTYIHFSHVFKIAEFLHMDVEMLLGLLFRKGPDEQRKAAALLYTFYRLGPREQHLLQETAIMLEREQEYPALTPEQEQAMGRLIAQPEFRHINYPKHLKRKEEEEGQSEEEEKETNDQSE